MAFHNDIGTKGEDAAASFLEQNGHTILVRNYRHAKAEVDIISKDKNAIVFTEVKTRASESFGYPEESVNKKKRSLLKQAAEEYMYQHKLDADIRFDIISIIHTGTDFKVQHFKDAFFHEE